MYFFPAQTYRIPTAFTHLWSFPPAATTAAEAAAERSSHNSERRRRASCGAASCGIYPTRWSRLNIYKLVNITIYSSYNYIYIYVYLSLSLALSPSPSPGVQHLAEGEPRTAWQFNARAQLLGVSYHQAKQQVTLKSLLLLYILYIYT